MPSGTLVAGDFSQLAYCFFGDGFMIDTTQFNSATDFASGINAMRLMVSADIIFAEARRVSRGHERFVENHLNHKGAPLFSIPLHRSSLKCSKI
jgi:hypothetical protein